MKTFLLGVDYKEFDEDSYNGVFLRHSGEVLKKVNTGNFSDDFERLKEWLKDNYESEDYRLMRSSSLDSYLIDTN